MAAPLPRLRRDRQGAEETFQALPALLITIVCVGLVFGAMAALDDSARAREAGQRAQLQAQLFVEALPAERALAAPGDAVSWDGASAVASGTLGLTFVPPRACVATLLDTLSGEEVFLLGSLDALTPSCEVAALPVPVLRADGTTVPGLLRAGVLLS
ncbi:MAG TPA: hypothetical protein VGB42_00485 [Candidatus Thermoplasmatota archaeon]